ncbi:hypothetical protein PM082_024551 [Marasmius tenuissimus]|nr:hypothetical protein PM082_024551 [Marasmius tenuissimus]
MRQPIWRFRQADQLFDCTLDLPNLRPNLSSIFFALISYPKYSLEASGLWNVTFTKAGEEQLSLAKCVAALKDRTEYYHHDQQHRWIGFASAQWAWRVRMALSSLILPRQRRSGGPRHRERLDRPKFGPSNFHLSTRLGLGSTHGPLAYIRQLQTRLLHLAHARISPAVPEQLPLFSYVTTFQYHDLHNPVDIAILILSAQRAWEFATTRTSPAFAPLD